jgi:hypothetical protein
VQAILVRKLITASGNPTAGVLPETDTDVINLCFITATQLLGECICIQARCFKGVEITTSKNKKIKIIKELQQGELLSVITECYED